MTGRTSLLARLAAGPFDVIIVGGGIVGAGIARDAVLRGLRVALVEQGDFAGGTSSKTSKLIHGGLRYLEHGHLRLVLESLRERHVLWTIAPSLVRPLPILLPLYAGGTRGTLAIRLGLALYDLLATGRRLPRGLSGWRGPRVLGPRRALALEPALRVDGLRAAGIYADCQMDDARLCLANILQATGFGAVCANYVRVVAFLRRDGRLCGVTAQDVFSGRTLEIRAGLVVNATGPWGDAVRRLSDRAAVPALKPTKGIHLVLPRLAERAVYVEARRDHRMLFALPWNGHTLAGTTEGTVDAPLDTLSATADEVGYLLEELNRVLPGSRVEERDVIATFAGARPLLGFSGAATGASREHRLEIDAAGLISILGGKYTTYRVMAQQVVDVLARRLGRTVDRCLTDEVTLLERPVGISLEQCLTGSRRVPPDTLARCLARYGTGTLNILRLIGHEPALAHPVCPHHPDMVAELVHALQQELAWTLTDLLARRTRIAWSSCQGLDALSTLAQVVQRYGGAEPAEIARQLDAYQQWLALGQAFHPLLGTGSAWRGAEAVVE